MSPDDRDRHSADDLWDLDEPADDPWDSDEPADPSRKREDPPSGGYPLLFRGGPPPEGLTDRLKDHVTTFIGILAEFLPGARRPPAPRPDPARKETPPSPSGPHPSHSRPHPSPADPPDPPEPRPPPDTRERRPPPDPREPPILFPADPDDEDARVHPSPVRLFGESVAPHTLERATLQMLPGRLEPLSPALSGRQVRFLKGPGKEQEVTIGRGPGEPPSHVTLDHPSLREAHARMLHRDGQWFVTSSHQADPILLNGEEVPVAHPHPLEDGDLLRFGELEFRFRWP